MPEKKKKTLNVNFSQLTVSRLNWRLTIFLLEAGDLSTLPTERLESLGKDRVRVVVACIQPVSVHGAQVLDLQLEKGLRQLLRITETDSKGILMVWLVLCYNQGNKSKVLKTYQLRIQTCD